MYLWALAKIKVGEGFGQGEFTLLCNLGIAYLKDVKTSLAIDSFLQAIRIEQEEDRRWLYLGIAYLKDR